MLVALGNAAALLGLAAAVWWYRVWLGEAGSILLEPMAKAPAGVESVEMPIPPVPPASMRKKLPRPPGEELIIDLDSEGNIRLAGEPMDLGALRMRLCKLHADYRRRVVVTIRASDDCLFRHVRDVMNVCDECVISSYNLSAPPVPSNPGRPGPNDTSAV